MEDAFAPARLGPVDLRKLEIEFRAAADEIAWLRESQEAAAQARLAAA